MEKDYKGLIVSKLDCTSNVKFTTASCDFGNKILGRCYELPEDSPSTSYDALFLGSENNLLKALAMSIPVSAWYYFDSSDFHSYTIHDSAWRRKRNFLIEKIKDAEIFGIVIATLNVTHYLKITAMLKSILTVVGKKTYVFSIGKLSPTKLANFQEVRTLSILML